MGQAAAWQGKVAIRPYVCYDILIEKLENFMEMVF